MAKSDPNPNTIFKTFVPHPTDQVPAGTDRHRTSIHPLVPNIYCKVCYLHVYMCFSQIQMRSTQAPKQLGAQLQKL